MVPFTHIFHPTIWVVINNLDKIFAIKRTLISNPKPKYFGNTKVNERNESSDECNPTIYIQINVPSQLELPKMEGMEHDMDECLNPPYI